MATTTRTRKSSKATESTTPTNSEGTVTMSASELQAMVAAAVAAAVAQAQPEKGTKASKAKRTVDPGSDAVTFTVQPSERDNRNVHLVFSGKPSEAIRDVLKAHGFRWSRQGHWYGRMDAAHNLVKVRQVKVGGKYRVDVPKG